MRRVAGMVCKHRDTGESGKMRGMAKQNALVTSGSGDATAKAPMAFEIELAFRGAQEIRSLLGMDDKQFLAFDAASSSGSRDYFVYAVLDEVERSGYLLLHVRSLLAGGGPNGPPGRSQRNLLTELCDRLDLQSRKVHEALIDVSGFCTTNTPDFFQEYLLLRRREGLAKRVGDVKEFFGIVVANLNQQLADVEPALRSVEKRLGPGSRWYRAGKDSRLASVSSRFKAVFPSLAPETRLELGVTYQGGYGAASASAHFMPHEPRRAFEVADLRVLFVELGSMVMHVLIGLRKLLGDRRRRSAIAIAASEMRRHSRGDRQFPWPKGKRVRRGDFVSASGVFARVIGVRRSKYGLYSFHVRFLEPPTVLGLDRDWIPMFAVKRIHGQREIINGARAEVVARGEKPLSRARLDAELERLAVEGWRRALAAASAAAAIAPP